MTPEDAQNILNQNRRGAEYSRADAEKMLEVVRILSRVALTTAHENRHAVHPRIHDRTGGTRVQSA